MEPKPVERAPSILSPKGIRDTIVHKVVSEEIPVKAQAYRPQSKGIPLGPPPRAAYSPAFRTLLKTNYKNFVRQTDEQLKDEEIEAIAAEFEATMAEFVESAKDSCHDTGSLYKAYLTSYKRLHKRLHERLLQHRQKQANDSRI
jgi:hypothetical protein